MCYTRGAERIVCHSGGLFAQDWRTGFRSGVLKADLVLRGVTQDPVAAEGSSALESSAPVPTVILL